MYTNYTNTHVLEKKLVSKKLVYCPPCSSFNSKFFKMASTSSTSFLKLSLIFDICSYFSSSISALKGI